jgi:hypothetical protein
VTRDKQNNVVKELGMNNKRKENERIGKNKEKWAV